MMTAQLSVNLNKVALLRNSRLGDLPSLADAAALCIASGCHGITLHPRPDQRHVRVDDLAPLRELLADHRQQPETPDGTAAQDASVPVGRPVGRVELNIEGNPFAEAVDSDRSGIGPYPGFMALALATRPDQCTLVPDSASQLTSDHGFDLKTRAKSLAPLIATLREAGIRVSVFVDPEPEQMSLAAQIGADRVELYTGPYALRCVERRDIQSLLAGYQAAALAAQEHGLGVNAGHDLNLDNLRQFIGSVPGVLEVSIGHALVADALRMGMPAAVQAYLDCLSAARPA